MEREMQTETTRYFLSKDFKTQIAAPMTDELHRMIWSRFSYSSRPYEGVEMVEVEDHLAWIKHQIAIGPAVARAMNEAAMRNNPERVLQRVSECAA